jgi:hypothetical protein
MNMDEIETMLAPGGKFEPTEAVEHSDTISIMLMSFPPPAFRQHQSVATGRLIAIRRRTPWPRPICGAIFRISISGRRRHRSLRSMPRKAKTGKRVQGTDRAACAPRATAATRPYMKTE